MAFDSFLTALQIFHKENQKAVKSEYFLRTNFFSNLNCTIKLWEKRASQLSCDNARP
jgi:hypothetical protein